MIDNIVFVLAINRTEIAHSIKAIYGHDFNAQGYLRRFIDIDFKLQTPDHSDFIDSLLTKVGFADYLTNTKDQEARGDFRSSISILKKFFGTADISCRMIEQAIYRLGLLFRSLSNYQKSFMPGAIIASILRTIKPDLYHKFIHKEVEDDVLVRELFRDTRVRLLGPPETNSFSREVSYFMATVILATVLQDTGGSNPSSRHHQESPLLSECRRLIESDEGAPYIPTIDAIFDTSNTEIARKIVGIVDKRLNNLQGIADFGFWYSVKRLELISPEFLEDRIV